MGGPWCVMRGSAARAIPPDATESDIMKLYRRQRFRSPFPPDMPSPAPASSSLEVFVLHHAPPTQGVELAITLPQFSGWNSVIGRLAHHVLHRPV